MNVVITQSMLFPWVGMLEQMRLADVFIHYDDVQFSKGGLTNRVQIKTLEGVRWMTVPLRELSLGQVNDAVALQDVSVWRNRHLGLLKQSLLGAPFALDALHMVEQVYAQHHASIGALARASMLALANYYGLFHGKRVLDVRDLDIGGSSSTRVLDIVSAVGGDVYITGHGARNYLDHVAFERAGVQVRYMQYELGTYPQRWGSFTPYVSGLDLVANCGVDGIDRIFSKAVPWRDFLTS